jgi:hypothetical protein
MENPDDLEIRRPDDVEIRKTASPPNPLPPPPPDLKLWFIAAVFVVLGTVAFFFFKRQEAELPPPRTATAPAAVAPADRPLGTEAAPIVVPPLDETDALVRKLVGELSSHPRVAAWLATNGLLRNFVVAVENISIGRTPARQLRALRPTGPFRVVERGESLRIDPASYERYTPLAGAIQSIDAGGAARLYTTFKPRLEEAYRELGHEESFDRALEDAIVALLAVPALEGDASVAPKGALYAYDDPRLERLTAAQKQLARMGTRNVRIIQAKLREVAIELGIRTDRLPG